MAQPMHDDLPPIPPEVVNPDTGPDWVQALMDYATQLADEASLDADTVGADLAHWGPSTMHAPEPARRWQITDDGSAEWAMAHVVDADLQLQQLGAQADAWAARIRQWFDHRARPLQAKQAFFQAHLMRYALARREADPKAKTLTLPSGAVKTIEQAPKPTVADEAAVVQWVTTMLDADTQQVVAPPQPRKLYVTPLREHLQIVTVIDHAQLLLASAELVEWVRHGWVHDPSLLVASDAVHGHPNQRCPQPGDGWPTPADATDLVARVEVLTSHDEVQGPDGLPVPGMGIDYGGVTAKVVPAP